MAVEGSLLTSPGDRSSLIERLGRAVFQSRRSKWARALIQPGHVACLRSLRRFGKTRKVNAQTFFGATMAVVLPEEQSKWIWRYGYVDDDVCLFLLAALPRGGRYIEVGAHFGFFALLGAFLVGEAGSVLALEPTPNSYKLLRENTAAYAQIQSCQFAAFSDDRQITLYDYGIEFSGLNSAGGTRPALRYRDSRLLFAGGLRRPISKTEIKVEAKRLDTLIEELGWKGVDVIKIDAESAESHILRGLEGTIAAHRPAFIIEVGDCDIEGNVDSRQIVEWFEDHEYTAFEVEGKDIVPHRKQNRYRWGNLLFIGQ